MYRERNVAMTEGKVRALLLAAKARRQASIEQASGKSGETKSKKAASTIKKEKAESTTKMALVQARGKPTEAVRRPVHAADAGDVAAAPQARAVADPGAYRRWRLESRRVFWMHFGVNLRNGSFFESNPQKMPDPVALLLALREKGGVSDEQLEVAWRMVQEARSWLAERQESAKNRVGEAEKPRAAKWGARRP
jgi:hypothetical protein